MSNDMIKFKTRSHNDMGDAYMEAIPNKKNPNLWILSEFFKPYGRPRGQATTTITRSRQEVSLEMALYLCADFEIRGEKMIKDHFLPLRWDKKISNIPNHFTIAAKRSDIKLDAKNFPKEEFLKRAIHHINNFSSDVLATEEKAQNPLYKKEIRAKATRIEDGKWVIFEQETGGILNNKILNVKKLAENLNMTEAIKTIENWQTTQFETGRSSKIIKKEMMQPKLLAEICAAINIEKLEIKNQAKIKQNKSRKKRDALHHKASKKEFNPNMK